MKILDKDELIRYSRQTILPEIGTIGQQKLKLARALVVGAGGLGCPVLQYLAAAGVGHIGIVDDDIVDLSNLHRQILYTVNDLGAKKAEVAKQKLLLLNPKVQIIAYDKRLSDQNIENIIGKYDLIIDGSDNFPTRYLVNDACVVLGKPLVFGSIFKFEGQVSVFNYQNGPNYRDLFPEQPGPEETSNCSDIGVIGVLPGIIGTLMANEAVKIICGIGDVLSGKLLTLDALGSQVKTFLFNGSNHVRPVSEISSVDTKRGETDSLADSTEIDGKQLKSWLGDGSRPTLLIDVREAFEFDEYNIGGLNIPLYELSDRLAEIREDRRIVFCCKSGIRSRQAVAHFFDLTKRTCYHLKGGIEN